MRRIHSKRKNEQYIKLAGLASGIILLFIILYQTIFPIIRDAEQEQAIVYMEQMIAAVADHCERINLEIDPLNDPAMTGLIGPEWTEMTTTIGHVDAKRTSIQPEFAALIVRLLREAGVEKGDVIGLASSGSFPGLMLASLSAAKAMDLKCRTILSVGSSSFGANRPDLTVLDIYQLLLSQKLIENIPVAVSLGGEQDSGYGWEPYIIEHLSSKIKISNYPFIREEKLLESAKSRAKFIGLQEPNPVKVLINSGGAMANIGTNESILRLKPGVVAGMKMPPEDQQGLIHLALIKNIPVIHLLYLKGLVAEYGLHWDPAVGEHAE